MMALGELKQHKNGMFYVHWTEGRRSKRISTRRQDIVEAAQFLAAWRLGPVGRVVHTGPTCVELWEAYYNEHLRSKTIAYSRGRAAWGHLRHAFADLRPLEITQPRLHAYEAARMSGKGSSAASRATVWQEINLLVTSWNFGIKTGRLRPEQRGKVIFPPPAPSRDRWLKDDEAERFLRSLVGLREEGGRLSRVERFTWIALETGARKRVVETLTWDQIDLEAGVIHYHGAQDPRTAKRRPSVPISSNLAPLLERAYRERGSGFVLDHAGRISNEFEAAAARAQVRGLTPHVLRHTAATWMARRGISLWQIAGVLGNSVGMVERVYAKHCPTGLAEAVSQISGGSRRDLSWRE